LNLLTYQLTNSLQQRLLNNDSSYNDIDNRTIDLQYTVETPTNLYSFSTISHNDIADLLRHSLNQPTNSTINPTTNINRFHSNYNSVDSQHEVETEMDDYTDNELMSDDDSI